MSRSMGVHIEGIGFDDAKTKGACFCNRSGAPTTGSYEWINAMVGDPGSMTTKINPFKGSWTAPQITLKLDRSARLASALLSTPASTPYTLSTSHTDSATTVFFTDATGLSAGDVVFVGDEAIKLGTVNTATSFAGCTRGFWGTSGQVHGAGAAVFVRNPYLKRRVVSVVSSVGGVDTIRWAGLIRNIRQQGPHITIEVDSLLQSQARARLNLEAVNLRKSANLNAAVMTWSARTKDRVRTATFVAGEYLEAFQVGEKVCVFVRQDSTAPERQSNPVRGWSKSVALGPSENFDDLDKSVLEDAEQIYRVFCVDRDLDQFTAGSSSTSDLTYPYHPLAIALALLTSTGTGDNGAYDVLGASWGLGLRYVDFTSFTDHIAERPGLAIDRLILGWDGDSVNVDAVVREKLLRPYGYTMTVNNLGQLAVVKLRMPDLNVRADATTNSLRAYAEPHPTQDMRLPDRSRRVVLNVGGEPYGRGERITLEMDDRSTRAGRLDDVPAVTLDLSTVKPERLHGGDGLTEFAQTIIQGIAISLDAPPVMRLRCASYLDTGLDLSVGDWASVDSLEIEEAWWINGDGDAIQITNGTVQGAGLVISVTQQFHGSDMSIEMLMLGHRLPGYIRLTAPSGLVDSWDALNNAATLANTEFTGSDDAASFKTGDELELWTSKGALKSTTTPTIITIAAGVITMSGTFGAGTPLQGDYLRVASSVVYDNTTHITGVSRPWAMVAAQANQTFEDSATSVTYDVWGTEFFVGAETPTPKSSVPDFKSLDDDVITAASSTAAYPLDTFVQQTLQDREAWLLTRDLPCAQMLQTHHSDTLASTSLIRPFCGATDMTVSVVPIMMQAGWMGAHCAMIARCANEYANNIDTGVFVRLDLYGPDWIRIKKGSTLQVRETETSTPVWQPVEVSLKLNAPLAQATAGYLVLWVSSAGGPLNVEAQDSTSSGTFGTDVPDTDNQSFSFIVQNGNTFLDDTAATRPNSADFATSGFAIQRYSSDNGGRAFSDDLVDPLWRRNLSGDRELLIGPDPIGGGFVNAIDRFSMTYLQVRAIEWSIYYADIGRSPVELLRPLAPVLGEVAGAHVTRTKRALVAPRLAHVGPAGDTQDPYSGALGYAQRWPRETHDNATATHIEEEAILIPARKDPELMIIGLVLPTLCVPNFTDFAPEDPLSAEWSTKADWQIDADVYGTGAAGWTGPANVTLDATFDHWYTFASQQGALTSELAQFSGNFPYREGSMYDKDLKYLQPFVMPLGQVSYDPSSADEFIRVRLRFDGTGTPTYTKKTSEDYRTEDRVQIALVAWSIFEVV